jgi:hypothetical protein
MRCVTSLEISPAWGKNGGVPDDEDATREQRAEELREEIERLRSGTADEAPPASPREFVEKQMREEADAVSPRSDDRPEPD